MWHSGMLMKCTADVFASADINLEYQTDTLPIPWPLFLLSSWVTFNFAPYTSPSRNNPLFLSCIIFLFKHKLLGSQILIKHFESNNLVLIISRILSVLFLANLSEVISFARSARRFPSVINVCQTFKAF